MSRQIKVVRDKEQRDKSKGFGFVEFTLHENALAALRQVNNNPDYFGEKRRLLVEFALEDQLVLRKREFVLKRQRTKETNKTDDAVEAPTESNQRKRKRRDKQDKSNNKKEDQPAAQPTRGNRKANRDSEQPQNKRRPQEAHQKRKTTEKKARKKRRQQDTDSLDALGMCARPALPANIRSAAVASYKQKLFGAE
jgi:nucleolar protein 4